MQLLSVSTPLNLVVPWQPVLKLSPMTNILEKQYGRNDSAKMARFDFQHTGSGKLLECCITNHNNHLR